MQISRMDEAGLYRLPQGLGGPWELTVTLCLERVAWSWSVSAVCYVGGESSGEFSHFAFRRTPTLIFIPSFIQKINKVGTS